MLSFKDIKIIESDREIELDRGNISDRRETKIVQKVTKSLKKLLISRLEWDLKENFSLFLGGEKPLRIKVVQGEKESVLASLKDDYIKLRGGGASLYALQRELILFSDFLWRGRQNYQVRKDFYFSDIFLARKWSEFILHSLKRAIAPLMTLDDYRINEFYKKSISHLEGEDHSFFLEFSFEDFSFRVLAHLEFTPFFLKTQGNKDLFDISLVSV